MPRRNLASAEKELSVLIASHKELKLGLPVRKKSKKWALWLLQGASLSLTQHCVNQIKSREGWVFLCLNLRLATEMLNLATSIAHGDIPLNSNNKSKDVSSWFNTLVDNFFYEKKLEYTQFKGAKSYTDESKKINNFLSVFSHPSYTIVKNIFNFETKKGSLDYYSIPASATSEESSTEILDFYLSFSKDIMNLSIGQTNR